MLSLTVTPFRYSTRKAVPTPNSFMLRVTILYDLPLNRRGKSLNPENSRAGG